MYITKSYRTRCTGSPERLYDSVHEQILSLPKDCLLFPAHDYKGTAETIHTVI